MMGGLYPRYGGDTCSYYFEGERHPILGHKQEVGQILVDQNFRSVNYHYEEDYPVREYVADPPAVTLSPVAILKACDCYDYQACETPDYWETEAFAIVRAIRNRAIRLLPGYDEAEAWPVR
jgi:hypothetical protein